MSAPLLLRSAADPVAVRGVAEAHLLLTDGCGPLFFAGAEEELRDAIRCASANLEFALDG